MNIKRIIGIILVLCGIGLIGTSMYITQRVEEGKGEVGQAKQQVEQGTRAFSWNPYTKEIGEVFTGSARSKIAMAEQDIEKYEKLAKQLKFGGIVLLVVGIGVIFIKRKK